MPLGTVTANCALPFLFRATDIDDKARRDSPWQPKVQDCIRAVRRLRVGGTGIPRACQIRGGCNNRRRGRVVGVGLVGMVSQHQFRTDFAKERNHSRAVGIRINQTAIAQIESFAKCGTKHGSGLCRFSGALCNRASRACLPPCQIDDGSGVSKRSQAMKCAAGVKFDIVGMGANCQSINHLGVGHKEFEI